MICMLQIAEVEGIGRAEKATLGIVMMWILKWNISDSSIVSDVTYSGEQRR